MIPGVKLNAVRIPSIALRKSSMRWYTSKFAVEKRLHMPLKPRSSGATRDFASASSSAHSLSANAFVRESSAESMHAPLSTRRTSMRLVRNFASLAAMGALR